MYMYVYKQEPAAKRYLESNKKDWPKTKSWLAAMKLLRPCKTGDRHISLIKSLTP